MKVCTPWPVSEGRQSVATVIREAIDRGLPATQQRRLAAGRRMLAAEPMWVEDLLTELDDLRGRHA